MSEHNHDHGHDDAAHSHESGLVSLDQARDIALAHARDNLELYDRRYRRQPLVWEVLTQEEREAAYYFRLSFQPAQGFRGKTGVEEFNISKNGSIHSRLIISQPDRQGGVLGCALTASVALAGLTAVPVGGLGVVSLAF